MSGKRVCINCGVPIITTETIGVCPACIAIGIDGKTYIKNMLLGIKEIVGEEDFISMAKALISECGENDD